VCGVFGIVQAKGDAAPKIYTGLTQIQHRAHDSAGIATYDEKNNAYHVHKGMGEVATVFTEEILSSLSGSCGIGHVRWTTEGDMDLSNAHPLIGIFRGKPFYLVHNGEVQLDNNAVFARIEGTATDTKFIAALISNSGAADFKEALRYVCFILKGTYALVVLFENKVYAIRDITGNRPLILGTNSHSFMVASESAAFRPLGGNYLREIERGEVIVLERDPLRYSNFEINQHPLEIPPHLQFCLFEMIYLLRPDSVFLGRTVELVRERMGAELFLEHPLSADMIIGVPDSGEAAAYGYAFQSGLPMRKGILRSHYAGRMFIEPVAKRAQKLLIKLSVIKEIVAGKRIIVIDDSIVEGGTSKKIVALLREAEAREIYVLSSSPPITHPCFYGVPTARKHRRLIARDYKSDITAICREIGADYLGYLSLYSTMKAVIETPPIIPEYASLSENSFCAACFTGIYPIPLNAGLIKENF